MTTQIRAVLFDLGGTLMYSRDPWDSILEQGYRALAGSLCAQGFNPDGIELSKSIRQHMDRYLSRRDEDLFEDTYQIVLREFLAENGYPDADEGMIRRALDAFYAHTQSNWILEEDALLTLRTLEAGGYRMGLVSNAGDNRDVLQLVGRFKIEPFFDFILTSAICSYRKPHPRIFELALEHWNIPPNEIAMVGDSLDADVRGAQELGIYAVWLSRRVSNAADRYGVKPEAEIKSLDELPTLLRHLAG